MGQNTMLYSPASGYGLEVSLSGIIRWQYDFPENGMITPPQRGACPQGRIMKKVLALATALAFTSVFAQDYIMGINFDAGGKFDKSFNEGTFNGFTRAIEEQRADGLDIQAVEFEGTPETFGQGLRQMAEDGADLIVAPGFSQVDAIRQIAAEFPDTNFVSLDGFSEAPGANELYISFSEHEGSYLVGYIAGSLSQTGTVGFVGGMDIPLIRKFDLGYQEGVKAACADCTIISNYVGTTPAAWNDPAKGKELAASQQAQGADIIYAAAGSSGLGVVDFVTQTMCYENASPKATPFATTLAVLPKGDDYTAKCGEGTQPLFFIGVDSNQNYLGDTDGNVDTLNLGLTSMLKRVDVAAENAVNNVIAGTFEGGYLNLGLAEDGVGYALDDYNNVLIPQEVLDAVDAVRDSIIAGETVVTDFTAQ
jgi:basic membrane protein A and related proteins